MITNLQLAKLSDLVYQSNGGTNLQVQTALGTNWVRYANLDDLGLSFTTGYYATAYRNAGTGEIVIAHRGMQLTDGNDIVAVLKTAQGMLPEQFASAREFVDAVKVKAAQELAADPSMLSPIYIQTGHSLGGGLASLMGALTGESTVAFNAIGVKEVMQRQQVGLDPNAGYGNIRSISSYFDPAKLVGTRIGQVRNFLVSSYWLVPDAVEVVLAGLLSVKAANLLPMFGYLFSQHKIGNMVEVMTNLPEGSGVIPDGAIPLSITQDYVVSGAAASTWSDLQGLSSSDERVAVALDNPTYRAEGELLPAQMLAEGDANLAGTRQYVATDSPALIAGLDGGDQLTGGAGGDLLFGDGGQDVLDGGAGADILIGGEGSDTLTGGAGADYLLGGNGVDTYYVDEEDTVVDSDGKGVVYLNNELLSLAVRQSGESVWRDSSDNEFELIDGDLIVNGALTIQDFSNKDLGIYLDEEEDPSDPNRRPSPPPYNRQRSVQRWDPLVFDLNNNNAIDAYGSNTSSIYFDFDNNGISERAGWLYATDGFLALDSNTNGFIDGLAELFGSANIDGFDELATYDSNNDGRIDASDSVFSHLLVWKDLSQDGISQANEISSLAALGISEIGLVATPADYSIANNVVAATGTYTVNGEQRLAADIRFAIDFAITDSNPYRPLDQAPSISSQIFDLPWLRGYGGVKSLHVAYQENTLLLQKAIEFSALDEIKVFGRFDEFMSEWTGLRSEHSQRGLSRLTPTIEDKVWMLEKLNGQYFSSPLIEANNFSSIQPAPGTIWDRAYINSVWGQFTNRFSVFFVLQKTTNNWIQGASYSLNHDRFVVTDAVVLRESFIGYLNNINNFNQVISALVVTAALKNEGLIPDTTLIKTALTLPATYLSFIEKALDEASGFSWTQNSNDSFSFRYGDSGAEVLLGSAGSDNLNGGAGADLQNGGDGSDALYGGSGSDVLLGGAGNDYLSGDDDADVLDGGTGADTLIGGLGGDTYLFGIGSGNDSISENDSTSGHQDVVRFSEGVIADDIEVSWEGSSVSLQLTGSQDQLTLSGWLNGPAHMIERFEFEDGLVWSVLDIQEKLAAADAGDNRPVGTHLNDILDGHDGNDSVYGLAGDDLLRGGGGNDYLYGAGGNDDLRGGAGSDVLYGAEGGDVLDGGLGDDLLWGGSDSDIYHFGIGYGHDVIYEYSGETNTIVLGADIEQGDVNISRDDSNLFIELGDASDRLTINGWFHGFQGSTYPKINALIFDDGTVLQGSDIEALANAINDGDNVIFGNPGNDLLNGLGGNDYIRGFSGDDQLIGGSGNDRLVGGDGDDYLVGGPGVDQLDGGYGNDVYHFGPDSGHDVISDIDFTVGNIDSIAIASDVLPADLKVTRDHSSLYLSYNNNADRIAVSNWYGGVAYQVEQVIFGNGTIWGISDLESKASAADEEGNALYGTMGNDSISGLGGNDQLHGLDGNDFLSGDSGNDWLAGYAGNDHLVGGDESDQLFGDAGDDLLEGGGGSDYLSGGDGADVLIGGEGSDMLVGAAGNDTYKFGFGDGNDTIVDIDTTQDNGDTIQMALNVTPADVKVSRNMTSMYFDLIGSTDRLTVQNWFTDTSNKIESVSFSDGTVWSAEALENFVATADAGDNFLVGSDQDDLIGGLSGNDHLYGLDGIDHLEGDTGNDLLFGGSGSDFVSGGDGNDYLHGGFDNDVLSGDSGNDTLYGENGNDQLSGGYGNDYLDGGIDDDSLIGEAGNDQLRGGDGNDTLDGGADDDFLMGQSGNDTYRFGLGSGHDEIYDVDSTTGNIDSILIAEGLLPTDIKVSRDFSNLFISYNNNADQLKIRDWYESTDFQIEQILFGDGTIWDISDLESRASVADEGDNALYGTSGDDSISGFGGNDYLVGKGGNDVLSGGDGNDYLVGDYLISDSGNDILDGGAGLDELMGGSGNDTYKFGFGYGHDRVFDSDVTGGDGDTIQMAFGVDPADVKITRDLAHLYLSLNDGADQLTIHNWFVGGANKIENVVFSDGTTWDVSAVEFNISEALVGSSGDDLLIGQGGNDQIFADDGNDVLDGGPGLDWLYGGNGSDIYKFGVNSGIDYISEQDGALSDIDSIHIGPGVTSNEVVVTRDASSLTISRLNSNDSISIISWFDNPANEVESVVFADGTSWTAQELTQQIQVTPATIGDDLIYGSGRGDVIDGMAGSDQLYGEGGNDTLYGGESVDYLFGGDGDDALYGGAGYDYIEGNAGNDRIDGGVDGEGDSLLGGVGENEFVFGRGYGADTVSDFFIGSGTKIAFAEGLTESDIRVSHDGGNTLLFTINDTGETLSVFEAINSEFQGTIQANFQDGTTWDWQEIRARMGYGSIGGDYLYGLENSGDSLYGFEGSDFLFGLSGADTLDGGSGNDILYGGPDDDIYRFGLGYEADLIDEYAGEGIDKLQLLNGIAPEDVRLSHDGYNVYLNIANSADQVVLQGWLSNPDNLELIEFSNGDIWTSSDVITRLGYGSGDNDSLYGFENTGESLYGFGGDDSLHGLSGADTLDGGSGSDALYGGLDDDIYRFGLGYESDSISEYAGEGADTLLLLDGIAPEDVTLSHDGYNVYLNIANTVDQVTLQGWLANQEFNLEQIEFSNGVIWTAADVITSLTSGTEFDDHITGFDWDDLIQGFGGGDSLYGVIGNDQILGGTGSDYIDGGDGDDALYGGPDDDYLIGSEGNDYLDGGEGLDQMLGGTGDDYYAIDNIADLVQEGADEGLDTVESPFNYSLLENFENLTLTGSANLQGTGNSLDNVITGNSGNNTLNGLAGADELQGGAGNDTYIVDNSGDSVIEYSGEGVDRINSSIDFELPAEVENLTLTGSGHLNAIGNELANSITGNNGNNNLAGGGGNDSLIGGGGNDVLDGGAGNDSLNGGTGNDTMSGGEGDDTYTLDALGDVIIELPDQGTDTVNSPFTHTLSAEFENLILSGTSNLNGTGNASNNQITGNSGANTLTGYEGNDFLDGKAGADILIGGLGDDILVIDNAGDQVVENANEGTDTIQSSLTWTLGGNFENLTFLGTSGIAGTGNAGNNIIIGNSGANTLVGLGGNDILDGMAGNDSMSGGLGDDTYYVAQTGDLITENTNEGTDQVFSSITYVLVSNTEHLTLTGTANINGTGNTLANNLTGNSGINTLDGGLGADVMAGGAGNDIYVIDQAGDQVIELADEGVDLVRSSITFTLAANLENATLTGTAAINVAGNALDNALTGNTAANTLSGGGGNDIINGGTGADTMIGGTGNDSYTVDNAGDLVVELAGEGVDTVSTTLTYTLGDSVENLTLTGTASRNGTGNALANTLIGNSAANSLNGLAGNDILIGGLGNDIYRFDPGFGRDVIAEDDATAGNLDKIVFGAGITTADIKLGRLNNDLVVETADHQNSIEIEDWFAAARHQIERIEFAGGQFWDVATIESMAMQSVDMPGLLRGDNSASQLLGQIGNTLIEGQGGADILSDSDGNNLFSGGAGDDTAIGGAGNDLFVGGSGNDNIHTGVGSNVVAFNAGSGIDTVYSGEGADNTLSLGGGLRYSDLSLSRNSNDLVLNASATDQVVFKDWYAGGNKFANLQFILDASPDFDADATDPIYNRRVQSFDFAGMVSAFDAAQNNNPGISAWALGDALTQFHLSGSDDSALGGDLAYWYARNNALSGIGVTAAQQVIGATGFGAEAQALREFTGLQDGLIRLT